MTVLDAAERQQRKMNLISPRRGFYVIVPPQYRRLGAPPPSWYIDSLMRHEERPYYVGLLKAAELHGAAHQAVMEFQVVTDKRLPKVRAGRSSIVFYYRNDMSAIGDGIEERKTDTGQMRVSTPALTALDLLRYVHASGGLDNVLTVLLELGGQIDAGKLAKLSFSFERSIVQRLGYLLVRAGWADAAELLRSALLQRGNLPWVELEPLLTKISEFEDEPIERDDRWRVVIRRELEPDV